MTPTIFSMFISEMRENIKLIFVKFVSDTKRERVFVLDLHGSVLAAGRLQGWLPWDQVNLPQSFLMPSVGSGGISDKDSSWEK